MVVNQCIILVLLLFSIILVITGVYLIKSTFRAEKPYVDWIHSIKETAFMHLPAHVLPHPGAGYYYYELGGMKDRQLDGFDLGINEGYAKIDINNPYDDYAVGIYRGDDDKLIAYIRREQNEELCKFLAKNGGAADAKFQIWVYERKFYGIAYVKEEHKQ